ncbi:hypothetical protein MRX96_004488 [Rhipicephalus microplus]
MAAHLSGLSVRRAKAVVVFSDPTYRPGEMELRQSQVDSRWLQTRVAVLEQTVEASNAAATLVERALEPSKQAPLKAAKTAVALDYRPLCTAFPDERSDTGVGACALTRGAQTKQDKPSRRPHGCRCTQESTRRGRPIHGFFLPVAMLAHEGEIWTSGSDAGNLTGDEERSSTPSFSPPTPRMRNAEGAPATKPFA